MLPMLADMDPLDEVLPHTYFHIGPFGFTNHMVMSGIAAILMLLIFPRLFRKPESGPPTGAKNLFESILEYLRVEVFKPALKEHTDKFVPFLWTMFFFILFCNVLGCLPLADFVELITNKHITHFGGSATGNISTTAALAIIAFFFIHANGIDQIARTLMDGTYGHHADPHSSDAHDQEHPRSEALGGDVGSGDFGALTDPVGHYHDDHGPANGSHEESAVYAITSQRQKMTPLKAIFTAVPLYFWNFAPHPFRPAAGAAWTKWIPDIFMWGILLILEIIGAAVKPFALCVRLFANMVAGHVLLAVLIGLIALVPGIYQLAVGAPISVLDIGIQLLEIFVAFLQAYIFTFLTTLFIASAVAPEH